MTRGVTYHHVLSRLACSNSSRAGSIRTFWPDSKASRGNSDDQFPLDEGGVTNSHLLDDSLILTGMAIRMALPDNIHRSVHLQISDLSISRESTSNAHQALYWSTVAVITLAELSASPVFSATITGTYPVDIQATSPLCPDASTAKP